MTQLRALTRLGVAATAVRRALTPPPGRYGVFCHLNTMPDELVSRHYWERWAELRAVRETARHPQLAAKFTVRRMP